MNTLPDPNEITLTSERYGDFREALDILYINGNISGRNKFSEAWPDAAWVVFGEELLGYDREGTQDRARRTVLEQEAEERRLVLLEIVENVESKSVLAGSLQVEYVGGVVQQMGRALSLCVYSRAIVDRFIPPRPEEIGAAPVIVAPAQPEPVQEEIFEADLHIPEDPMDRIKPISVEIAAPDMGLRPDQEQAMRAQMDEVPEEAEDKPLFVAEKAPEVAPSQKVEVVADAPVETPIETPIGTPAPKKRGLNIFRISEAGGGPDDNKGN